MSRDLQDYGKYLIDTGLDSLKGQEMDGDEIRDKLENGHEWSRVCIYDGLAQEMIRNCWDDCEELDQEMFEMPITSMIFEKPCAVAFELGRMAVSNVIGDALDDIGSVEITDDFIANLKEKLEIRDLTIDGKTPEDKILEPFRVDPEMEFADINYFCYVRGYIADSLDCRKDEEIDFIDLPHYITEHDNMTGSIFCSSYKAEQFILKYWEKAKDTYEELKDEFDMTLEQIDEKYGLFNNPEAFQFCMVDFGVMRELSDSRFYSDHNDDRILLDDMAIATIKEELYVPAKLDKNIDLIIPESEADKNHYFMLSTGDILEWAYDLTADHPEDVPERFGDDEEAMEAAIEAYDNDEVYIPTVYDRNGKILDTDVTNYGRTVNTGSYEVTEFLGKHDSIEDCLKYKKERIEEILKDQDQERKKSRGRGVA